MKISRNKRGVVWVSCDSLRETAEEHVESLEDTVREFPTNRTLKELLEVYRRRSGLRGYALLDAHGKSEDGRWVFYDGERRCLVQNWIDQMDGRFLLLLLYCCNPRSHRIISERSIVVHGRGNVFDLGDHLSYNHRTMIYVPGEGYLGRSYQEIRRALERLRRR